MANKPQPPKPNIADFMRNTKSGKAESDSSDKPNIADFMRNTKSGKAQADKVTLSAARRKAVAKMRNAQDDTRSKNFTGTKGNGVNPDELAPFNPSRKNSGKKAN